MPRNFKVEGKRGCFTQETLTNALELIGDGISIREVAKNLKISRTTLSRYLKNGKTSKLKLGCKTFFTTEEEFDLAEYIKTSSKMFHGLSLEKARELAFLYAKNLKKTTIDKWYQDEKATEDWMDGFRKRHPSLSLRMPEATSLSRATAFNKTSVGEFFENLEKVCKKEEFSPDRIYNLDETGITTVQRPPKVLAEKGTKQLGQVVSAERGVLVTMCCCVSAAGQSLPPAYIFPRVHFKEHMMVGSPPSSLGLANKSGWMTSDIFPEVLRHFISQMSCSINKKVLLLLDNHSSHISAQTIKVAKENGVVLVTFPPHCSHKLQPLDVSVYGPFKSYFNSFMNDWMINHPGRTLTIYNLAELSAKAYFKGMSPSNIISGFASTGISPFNRNIFQEHHFMSSAVTDRQCPEQNPGPSTSNMSLDQSLINQVSSDSPLPPFPKAPPRQNKIKRRRIVSTILTSTPVKKVPFDSESEDDVTSPSLTDSEEITSEVDTEEELNIQNGKFVVVEFAQKRFKVHYVGEVMEIHHDEVKVDFYRLQNSKFVKPEKPDCYFVEKEQIVAILPHPTTQGRTERTLSGITFLVNMDGFNIR